MKFFGGIILAVVTALGILGSHQTKAEDSNINDILKNGFEELNATMANSERLALEGLAEALQYVNSDNSRAQRTIESHIKEASAELFISGVSVFYAVGKATSQCSAAREDIVQISKNYTTIALNIINSMRSATSLSMEGINIGGNASIKLIDAIRKDLMANYGALYKDVPNSLQESIDAFSDCNSMSTTANGPTTESCDEIEDDSQAQDAISELSKAAAAAIENGANASRVDQLNSSLVNEICDLAAVAHYGRRGFVTYANSVDSDPPAAMKLFSEVLETVYDRELAIFLEVCLDIGIVGSENNLTKEDLQDSYLAAENGIAEIFHANSLVKDMAFEAIQYQGDIREDVYDALKDLGRYGKMAFMQRIVEAGKNEFNQL